MDLMNHLSDKTNGSPTSCDDWFRTTTLLTSYYDNRDNRMVSIVYYGDPDLTLWESEDGPDFFSFLWQINGYLSNDPETAINIGGNIKTGNGFYANTIFTAEDIDDQVYSSTGEVVIERTGKLTAWMNASGSLIDSLYFELHERSIYYPDLDMTMRVSSFPRVSVDEAMSSSVYQLGGSSACSYITEISWKKGDQELLEIECPNEWADILKLTLSRIH